MTKKQAIWESQKYYQVARRASQDFSHPGLKIIAESAAKARRILEVGCGEGTKLATLTGKKSQGVGIDISETAIKNARKQYPHLHFQVADAKSLPFPDSYFDLVYSAFTLEHLQEPELVLKEIIRVLEPGGVLILLAPNYGAPNRASPCYQGNRLRKLIYGFWRDMFWLFWPPRLLSWDRVMPKATLAKYDIDWDVTVEPYIHSLIKFISSLGISVTRSTTFWGEVKEDLKFPQTLFSRFGKFGVYPFHYWGPHFIVVAQKEKRWHKNASGKLGLLLWGILILVLPLTIPLLILSTTFYLVRKSRLSMPL